MGRLQVIVGGQLGSEAKGSVAYWLAERVLRDGPLHCCRVGGPNAGHTAHDASGREWKLQQVPVGALHPNAQLSIAAGSVVDPEILGREVWELDNAGYKVSRRLYVDPLATLLSPDHALAETLGEPHGQAGLTARIGSTGKGVGAARAERVMRRALCYGDGGKTVTTEGMNVAKKIRRFLNIYSHATVQIEGTQGYGLGLHTPYYPYVTSTDCRAIDFMEQAGISPWDPVVDELEVWIVFRTFPIRVAGNSGPLLGETTWKDLGVPPEYTTVTKKERRVGRWDASLARQAIAANGGTGPHLRIALTFLDYVFPELRDCLDPARVRQVASNYIAARERELGHPISIVGTGPSKLVSLED